MNQIKYRWVMPGRFSNGHALVFGFCSLAYPAAFGINHLPAPKSEPRSNAPGPRS